MPRSDRYLLDPTGRPVRWTGMSERDVQAGIRKGYREVSRSEWKEAKSEQDNERRAA